MRYVESKLFEDNHVSLFKIYWYMAIARFPEKDKHHWLFIKFLIFKIFCKDS
jgi:hypothetical protein